MELLLDSAWTLREYRGDKAAGEAVPASVPGDLYSDLLRAGVMEDPYYRDNELAALKLSEKDYIYETTFSVDREIISRDRIVLHFDGLDTLAEIYLNGSLAGTADNMHRTWEYDVRGLLKAGNNHLGVVFRSPVRYIREKYAAKPLEGTEDAMRGFPYLRKAHCMFGWDWGPRLPGCGIFRPVRIIAYDTARISSVYVRQHHADHSEAVGGSESVIAGEVSLYLETEAELAVTDGSAGDELRWYAEITDPDGRVAACGDADQTFRIEEPKLWYPAGYGNQPLYTVRVTLCSGEQVLDTWEKRIGLRTAGVTRVKDEYGESFSHCINGIDIFAMGADYIPEDSLIARTCPERTRRLLEDARAANFNCIRVWGGGYYPEDWFYDICDELGLIVWQDLMFACAAYDLTYNPVTSS